MYDFGYTLAGTEEYFNERDEARYMSDEDEPEESEPEELEKES